MRKKLIYKGDVDDKYEFVNCIESCEINITYIARMSSVLVTVVKVVVLTAWCLTIPVQSQVSKCCDNQEIFYEANMTCGHTEVNKQINKIQNIGHLIYFYHAPGPALTIHYLNSIM